MLERLAQLEADIAHVAIEGDMDTSGLSEGARAHIRPIVLKVDVQRAGSTALLVYDDQGEEIMLDTGAEVPGVCDEAYVQRKRAQGAVVNEFRENLQINSAAKTGGSLGYRKTATICNMFQDSPRTVDFKVCSNFGARPLIGDPEFKARKENLMYASEVWQMQDDHGRRVNVPFWREPKGQKGGHARHGR